MAEVPVYALVLSCNRPTAAIWYAGYGTAPLSSSYPNDLNDDSSSIECVGSTTQRYFPSALLGPVIGDHGPDTMLAPRTSVACISLDRR